MQFDKMGVGDDLLALANLKLVGVEGELRGKFKPHEVANHGGMRTVFGDLAGAEVVSLFSDLPACFLEGGANRGAGENLLMHGTNGGVGRSAGELNERKGASGSDPGVSAEQVRDAQGVRLRNESKMVGSKALLDPFAVELRNRCCGCG